MKRNLRILGSVASQALREARSPLKMQGKWPRLGLIGLAIAGATALSACGQKGPLYLPAPAASTPSTSAAPAPQ
jgi:hypothetical protein